LCVVLHTKCSVHIFRRWWHLLVLLLSWCRSVFFVIAVTLSVCWWDRDRRVLTSILCPIFLK